MSLILCQGCGGLIDTDENPETWRGEKYGLDIWLCERCQMEDDEEGTDDETQR